MNKLTAKKCRAQIKEWEKMMLISDVSMMIENHLEAYRIALPVLEQQEKGDDGWIEWGGGECPAPPESKISVRLRGAEGEKYHGHQADWFEWNHYGNALDIIAYRVIENDGRE